MLLIWDKNAWEDYLWWQAQDRKVLKRINLLLKDIQRNGNDGIGKPEALKHDFAGYGRAASLTSTDSCTRLPGLRSESPPAATTTANAYDVHRAQVFGRCEDTTGIVPFTALVEQVLTTIRTPRSSECSGWTTVPHTAAKQPSIASLSQTAG